MPRLCNITQYWVPGRDAVVIFVVRCVCLCVCMRERERERERDFIRHNVQSDLETDLYTNSIAEQIGGVFILPG